MSCIIHIEYREEQILGWVEINGRSAESRSARRCRFQAIGWILHIVDQTESKIDPRALVDPDYAKNALIEHAMMNEESAVKLLSDKDWRRRFETVWAQLDNQEHNQAMNYDYDYWDNFWPGFDTFNRTYHEAFETLARGVQIDPLEL